MRIVVAGGQENISALNIPYFEWLNREQDPNVIAAVAHACMPMLRTAELVSSRYAIMRE